MGIMCPRRSWFVAYALGRPARLAPVPEGLMRMGGQGNREGRAGETALRVFGDRLVEGPTGSGVEASVYDGRGIGEGREVVPIRTPVEYPERPGSTGQGLPQYHLPELRGRRRLTQMMTHKAGGRGRRARRSEG